MNFKHKLPRHIADQHGAKGIFNSIHQDVDRRITEALHKVYKQHDIEPSSKLGILLNNGIHKLILGMHHLHDAITDLNEQLPENSKLQSKASIKRLFHEDFLKACESNQTPSLPTKERILLIEMGRTRVISNLLYKIKEYTGEDLRSSFKILGSLVRQTIDIYRELGGAEFNVSKNPPAHRASVEQQLLKIRRTDKPLELTRAA